MVALVQLLVAYAFGFAMPGWFLSKLLDVRPIWCGAFALSWLSLLVGVVTFQFLDLPLTFAGVLAWQVGITAIAYFAWRRCGSIPKPAEAAEGPELSKAAVRAFVGVIAVFILVHAWRLYMSPLTGGDVPTRWNGLSRAMLSESSLDFYPPIAPADYQLYFFADGIAPVVSAGYWFLYAAVGSEWQAATFQFVLMQWLVAIGFASRVAHNLAGHAAGWLTAGILVTTYFAFYSIGIGQDMGAACVGVAGAMALFTERREITHATSIAAALVVAVGALVREYGAILLLCAAMPIVTSRSKWKYLPAYLATSAVLMTPWYLRNLVRLGHPFHSLSIPFFEPASPMWAELMHSYRSAPRPAGDWYDAFATVVKQMPLISLLGLPAAVMLARRFPVLIATTGALVCVWAMSVPYVSGGVASSVRTLLPAGMILAIAMAIVGARLIDQPRYSWAVYTLLSAAAVWALILGAAFPFIIKARHLDRVPDAMMTRYSQDKYKATTLDAARAAIRPGERILSDHGFARDYLAELDVEVVATWNPEVAFVFDRSLTGLEVRKKLRQRGIRWALYYNGSLNRRVYETYPFYKDDLPEWFVASASPNGGIALLAIPPEEPGREPHSEADTSADAPAALP